MTRLSEKVAVITGAARGQGAAEARLFAEQGAKVILTDIDERGASEASAIGTSAMFLVHDVSSEQHWNAVVEAAVQRFGRIDILVNNAGIYRPASLLDTDDQLWEQHYRINMLGPFLGMRAVARQMVTNGGGSIINVSSNAGMNNVPGMFAYGSTKWALRGMTKLAASELAASGIRVNSIHPGIIDTPMVNANDPAVLAAFAASIPLGRLGRSDEVAQLALFLASDAASYVTGAEITIDGGIG